MAVTKKFLDFPGLTRYDENIKNHIEGITGELNNLETTSKSNLVSAINETNTIAKGANVALVSDSYSSLITTFLSLGKDVYKVGQSIFIKTVDVPDVWISNVSTTSSTYTYTTDEQVIEDINNGTFKVGYYTFSKLETEKIDLTDYVTNDELDEITDTIEVVTSFALNDLNQKIINNEELAAKVIENIENERKQSEEAIESAISDLGNDISQLETNKADKGEISTISYDSTNKKIVKTINGESSDIVSASNLVVDGGGITSATANNPTLSWGTQATLGSVGNVTFKVTPMSLPSKSDIGLGNVENKSSSTIRGELTKDNVTTALGYTPVKDAYVHPTDGANTSITAETGKALGNIVVDSYGHVTSVSNKSLTKSDVGLNNVTNEAQIPASQKGQANGVAELDSTGKVPSSQLPSYVDDVLEYANKSSFPSSGETGKIYVDLSTNLTYRWGGSEYVEISQSLALGTTSSTAFRGDYGNTAYSHANAKGSAFSSGLYKITTNSEGHVTDATAVVKSDITNLGIPGQDTKNTAGSTNSSDKLYLIGSLSQSENSQTYSRNTVYIGTDGHLYSNDKIVLNDDDGEIIAFALNEIKKKDETNNEIVASALVDINNNLEEVEYLSSKAIKYLLNKLEEVEEVTSATISKLNEKISILENKITELSNN